MAQNVHKCLELAINNGNSGHLLLCSFAVMESDTYSPYLRSVIKASMEILKESTSTQLLHHICGENDLAPTTALRTRMLRACKSMVAEIDMVESKTENKTPIYIIKIKDD